MNRDHYLFTFVTVYVNLPGVTHSIKDLNITIEVIKLSIFLYTFDNSFVLAQIPG